jgi:hypothetical protein
MPSLCYGKSLPTPKTGYGGAVRVVLDASFDMHVRILRLTHYAAPKHFDRLQVKHRNFYESPLCGVPIGCSLLSGAEPGRMVCDAHHQFDKAPDPKVPIGA